MKHLTYLFIFLAAMILMDACNDPIGPNGKEKPGSGPEAFGLVEITISGIGTQAMSASAKPAAPHTAFILTAPGGSSGPNDGTIQLEALSTGSYTAGVRGSGGVRYVYATFKVRNANVDENPYPNVRDNLTFLAVDNSQTHGVSAVSELKLYDTGLITGAAAVTFAEATIPTGRVGIKADGPFIPVQADVLQVLTPAEVSALSPPPGVDVFPYGFVTRSPNTTPASRDLPANPGSTQFDGLVTFTFKLPLQTQANQDPFGITFLVLPRDDSALRLTQSLEFQSQTGNAVVAKRFTELNITQYISIFPGSSYRGVSRLLCGPVRVSGTIASPVETLFDPPPTFVSLTPDPYAATSNNLPLTTDFDATFSGNVSGANAFGSQNMAGFVVHARQTGTKFINQFFTGENTPTLSSPNGIYSANEIIEVSLTGQLGSCPAEVARYRVGPTGGTGSFNGPAKFNVENTPVSTALGDIDGDGNMDIVIANSGSDNITVLMGDGTGSFSNALNSPYAAALNPVAVELGDLDNDGDLDMVYVAEDVSDLKIYLWSGTKFLNHAPYGTDLSPRDLALGDVNGDGTLDIVTANSGSDNVNIFLGNGSGEFDNYYTGTFTVGDNPQSVALGDVNKDGFLDIVTGDYGAVNGTTVSLLPGLGNGEFDTAIQFTVGTAPIDVALGDLDNDGNLDIATANVGSNDVSILLGDGLGGFGAATDYGPVNNSRSIALGDLNNDGFLDIVTANASSAGNFSELLNDGSGGFTSSTSSTGEPAAHASIGDINNDGSLDVVIAEIPATTSIDQVAVLEGQ